MNLAVVHPAFSIVGGSEIVALNQVRWLCKSQASVRIVTGDLDRKRWMERLRGIRVDRMPRGTWGERLWGRENSKKARDLAELLDDVDVAIAHSYPMSLWLAMASIPGRKVWYCHEPYRQLHLAATFPTIAARAATRTLTNTLAEYAYEAWERRGSPAMDAVRTRDVEAVRTFDTVCVNSNYTRSMAQRAYGCRDYRVVYPLMHLPERGRLRSGLRRNDLRILVHSRLEAAKNIDTILRGFAQFSKFPGRRAYLHVVGEGTIRPKLERLADELELNARVTFHGFVPQSEIERIYDICEILALAPIDEPFGMVFPEAAVRGLLILGPDHGGPFEIMDGGRLGFSCDPFSPASVAQAFQQIVDLTDREVDERRALAEESCRSRFSMETVGPQMLAAYGV